MGVDGPTMPLFTEQEQALRDELHKIEREAADLQYELEDETFWGYMPGREDFKKQVMGLFELAAKLLHLHNRAKEIHEARAKMVHEPPPPEMI